MTIELTVRHANDVQPETGERDGFANYRHLALEEVRETFLGMETEEGPYPYRMYPDPNGLLVWGTTLNADFLFWLTEGPDPDRWPVVVWFRGRGPDEAWQRFDQGMAQFLLDLLMEPASEVSLELLGSHDRHTWRPEPT